MPRVNTTLTGSSARPTHQRASPGNRQGINPTALPRSALRAGTFTLFFLCASLLIQEIQLPVRYQYLKITTIPATCVTNLRWPCPLSGLGLSLRALGLIDHKLRPILWLMGTKTPDIKITLPPNLQQNSLSPAVGCFLSLWFYND